MMSVRSPAHPAWLHPGPIAPPARDAAAAADDDDDDDDGDDGDNAPATLDAVAHRNATRSPPSSSVTERARPGNWRRRSRWSRTRRAQLCDSRHKACSVCCTRRL
jgi:hypothetical protein